MPTDSSLALDAHRLRALRDVKDLDRRYAHAAMLGRWDDVARLFTDSSQAETQPRIRPGAFHVEIIDEPIAHLSADGATAQCRWSYLTLSADGEGGTGISGGVLENDYLRTPEGWRIARRRRFPQFTGDHADGWTNVGGEDLPLVPFHFTPEETGIPLPQATDLDAAGPPPSPDATAALIGALEAEDAVRNLVHAYGYYVDRRMWTDVTDLFTDDAEVTLAPGGVFRGRDGVRAALETMGPEGLETGVLNDRPLFDTLVRVLPGGEATTRSIELGMLADGAVGSWDIRVLTTRARRGVDGIWRLQSLRSERLLQADYTRGWGDVDVAELTPPASDDPLVPGEAPAGDAPTGDLRRRLDRALAYDGVENVSSAYGYYIDDFQWGPMASLFAEHGNKQSPFAGYYIGRERITAAATSFWGEPPATRPGISYHWRTQPVITVSDDGRSASFRVRLFQPRTHREPSRKGEFYAAGFHSGMYPNDQAVLEDGVWRLWSLTIDEPYFVSPDWRTGWAGVPLADGDPPKPSRLMQLYPPDIPMTALGRRAEHFRGGTGQVRQWPEILPMWFHYRNPVSGRVPELYCPDCVPSLVDPATSMTAHGYQLPPDGPVSPV